MRRDGARPPRQPLGPGLHRRGRGRAVASHPQGLERQMATNHVGHAALVGGLWPLLHASAAPVEHRGARWTAVGANDPGAAAEPGALRRQAGLPKHQAGQPAVRARAAPPLPQGRFAGRRCRRASGCQATNLFARQLEHAGRGFLAPVSKLVTGVLLQSPAAGALSTPRALDPGTPSGAVVGLASSASSAAGRSRSTSTPPPRTRRRPRACGHSPNRRSAGRCRFDRRRSRRHPRRTILGRDRRPTGVSKPRCEDCGSVRACTAWAPSLQDATLPRGERAPRSADQRPCVTPSR
jgi:hypothetical protein